MQERRVSKLGIAGAIMMGLGIFSVGDGLIAEKHNRETVNQTYPEQSNDIVERAQKTRTIIGTTAEILATQDAYSNPDKDSWQKKWEALRLMDSQQQIKADLIIANEADARKEKLDDLNNKRKIDVEIGLGFFSFITGLVAFSYRRSSHHS